MKSEEHKDVLLPSVPASPNDGKTMATRSLLILLPFGFLIKAAV
jgi:hypothetical protein